MANEITASVTLAYDDGVTSDELAVLLAQFTSSGKRIHRITQTVPHSAEAAIKLGDFSSLGYAIFVNLDPTNYIDLKVATSGAIWARLDPDTNSDGKGGFAIQKLGSGAQVPYALANTADCKMAVFIVEA